MVGLTEGRLEGLRVDRMVGLRVDRMVGLRVDRTVGLKGGRMADRWVDQTEDQMVGLRADPLVDHSVVMKGALVVLKVEAGAEWLPSRQEVRGAKAVLLPRAVQQGLVQSVV